MKYVFETVFVGATTLSVVALVLVPIHANYMRVRRQADAPATST